MIPVPIGSIRRMVKGKGSLSVGSDFDRNVSDPRAVVDQSQTNELRGGMRTNQVGMYDWTVHRPSVDSRLLLP